MTITFIRKQSVPNTAEVTPSVAPVEPVSKPTVAIPRGRGYLRHNHDNTNRTKPPTQTPRVPYKQEKPLAQIIPRVYNAFSEEQEIELPYYHCEVCQDKKRVIVYNECEHCEGKGCSKCQNKGDIKSYINCQSCNTTRSYK